MSIVFTGEAEIFLVCFLIEKYCDRGQFAFLSLRAERGIEGVRFKISIPHPSRR